MNVSVFRGKDNFLNENLKDKLSDLCDFMGYKHEKSFDSGIVAFSQDKKSKTKRIYWG